MPWVGVEPLPVSSAIVSFWDQSWMPSLTVIGKRVFLRLSGFAELETLREACHRTEGEWVFGPSIQRKWNGILSTLRHPRADPTWLITYDNIFLI